MRIRQLITSRKLVLCIFLLLAFCCLVANVVPQHSDTPTRGIALFERHALVKTFIVAAGLDHVFSTPWFVILALVFLLSLVVSTYDQYRTALHKTWGGLQEMAPEGEPLNVPLADFQKKIKKLGYVPLGERPRLARFVSHPWGYWGNFFLHFGLSFSVLFALVYVVSEHRVIARLVEGEQILLSPDVITERKGILAHTIALPSALRLEKLEPVFWENDQLRSLGSEAVLTGSSGETERVRLAINEKTRYHDMTVYQKNSFGTAFFLRLEDGRRAPHQEILYLPFPARRDKAGYETVQLADAGLILKAKYYTDSARQSIYPVHPLLVLRLYDGDRMLGETALQTGQASVLGNYGVQLVKAEWWTDYLFEGSRGTFGIFTGFAFILAGVLLTYCVTPRTILVRQTEDGYRVSWQIVRFHDFYAAEKEQVFAACRGELT